MDDAYASAEQAIRIGAGAGFSGDRIDAAVDLASRGALQYLVFECLAERTVARAVQRRLDDPAAGYDPLLVERLSAVLPICARNGVKIISNMGAANARAAAARAVQLARELGLKGIKVAAITGDDVLQTMRLDDPDLTQDSSVISANAYIGAEPIVEALAQGADIVLTGRVADASLFLAPLMHEFGWSPSSWTELGRGVLIGHLLECAGQITGGYFADPGFKDVADLATLGFPIAEVRRDGSAIISKVEGTGGAITLATVKEQLLYELHDPRRYLNPDVTADFSNVVLSAIGPDRIHVTGGSGSPRPQTLKVSVGREGGFIGEGQISYGGPGAVARGRLALDILSERLKELRDDVLDIRFDLIGVNSLNFTDAEAEPLEVRARVAARAREQAVAQKIGQEVEALYTNGPAGGGGVSQSVQPVIAITSAFLDRSLVNTQVIMETA